MGVRGGELIAADEPTVFAKPLPDAVVMEDGQSDGCFANSASTDESDRSEDFCQTDDLLDQLTTSEMGPRWLRR